MLRSNLCDYRDACIVIKGRITVEGDNDGKTINKKMIFKTNAPFASRCEKKFLREKRVPQREKKFSIGENFLTGKTLGKMFLSEEEGSPKIYKKN